MKRLGIFLATTLVVLTACSDAPAPASVDQSTDIQADGGQFNDGSVSDTRMPDSGPCVEQLDLVVYREPLGPIRVFAKVRKDGQEVALLVDTGSQWTFLSSPQLPDGTPNVGSVDFGCGPRPLMGRPFEAHGEDQLAGMPVVGFLGADFFFESPTRLDLDTAKITRIDRGDVQPGAIRLPYTDVFGFLFVDVLFDGVPVKLGFDTGAPHSLWIGVPGNPGDTPVPSQDGFGNPITLYLGSTVLSSTTIPQQTVPVMRIMEHQSIQSGNQQMGIEAHGLFGLTSLPGSSIVIDSGESAIWLE